MTPKQIKNLLLVCPPTRNSCGDPRLQKALKTAEKNPELQSLLRVQGEFDHHIAEGLRAISPPGSLAQNASSVEAILSNQSMRAMSVRDPAILSIASSCILLIGLALWIFVGKISSFPGSTQAWQIVLEGDKMQAGRLDPIALKMDALGDWFAMKGMEQFWTPPALGHLDVVKGRVFTASNVPVAMGVVNKPRMSFYAFNGESLGGLPPRDGTWKILSREQKTIGVTGQGDLVFIIEIKGGRADLQLILQDLNSLSGAY